MKNLNVVELNAQELKNVEGGIAPLILAGWGAMILMDSLLVGVYVGYKNN
ncbi:class IIb bacteriocin, lactobin A/cerein 7B family [Flavobacterium davisii]|uniref:Class IIb bacteriocin, lactobin A/cerein 7B family n=1 Tax=Flavobacterium columnare TaxID=996 RepID=A0A8G0KQ52_9FLAO|nr:class IIb bacteriocin, lactobin A/cerein 7B family [Flavobacterium davisii]QYS87996.1 class IIb bacteriocin, lactobin A/cerein 7B family [Flavobacterium davisii]